MAKRPETEIFSIAANGADGIANAFWLGVDEYVKGFEKWRLAYLLGLSEIRRRYARSHLGQFWLTISTGVMVTLLGLVWAVLWNVPLAELLPYIATSLVLWTFINGVLADAPTVFITSGPLFLNQGTTFSVAVYGLVFRHLVIFLHNLPIVALVMIVFGVAPTPTIALAIPGLALLIISLVWMSYLTAILCLRFRDLAQVVQSALLMSFYLTPILWRAEQIPEHLRPWIGLNPLASLISVVREPLLGVAPALFDWLLASAFAFTGLTISLLFVGYCRRRLIYWI